MSVRPILETPHPNLRRTANIVTDFDAGLSRLVNDLQDTLASAGGIGLSATQIDDHRRVLVLVPSIGDPQPVIYVNPEIRNRSAWGLVEEKCLSVPGVSGNVIRATKVQVVAQNSAGEAFEHNLDGMDAVCLQHEIDHLDGVLFIDRLSIIEKLRLRIVALFKPARSTAA